MSKARDIYPAKQKDHPSKFHPSTVWFLGRQQKSNDRFMAQACLRQCLCEYCANMELLLTALTAVADGLINNPLIVIECNFKKQFLCILSLHTCTERGIFQVIHCSYYIFHIFPLCNGSKVMGGYRQWMIS